MKKLIFFLTLSFLFPPFHLLATNAEDPLYELGKQTYKRCVACHSINKKRNKMGPHLVKIWNRKIASVENFPYSAAFKKLDFLWNEENLSNYLENPRAFIPKNRMAFNGIKDKKRRDALIHFLKIESQKSVP